MSPYAQQKRFKAWRKQLPAATAYLVDQVMAREQGKRARRSRPLRSLAGHGRAAYGGDDATGLIDLTQLIFIRAGHEADFEHFEKIVLPRGAQKGCVY